MTEANARLQLAADLGAIIGADFTIVPDPRTIEEVDPGKKGTVQLVQEDFRLNPRAPQSQYLEVMNVWILTHQKEQPAAENDLDQIAPQVTRALERLGVQSDWIAKRQTHPNGFHAYKVPVTYITDKENPA